MIRVHRYLAAFVVAIAFAAFPAASFAGVFVGIGFGGGGGIGISVNFAPPPLPVYEQPPCYVPDTIWTPGYWAYGPFGYYWVPGTWVEAPQVGYLWTPGYWGYDDGAYAWHGGYWGRHVGYYGGVNYGFGYGGNGYDGGGWNGNHFRYNTAYTRINRTTINNVYVNRTVVNNYGNTYNRTSYTGGAHGLRSRPTANDLAYRSERHLPLTQIQRQHIDTAAQNRNFRDSVNHGRPNYAAVAAPLGRENRRTEFGRASVTDRHDTDPFSRFDRNSPSYATRTLGERNDSSRFGREKTTTDAFSRFDRNSPSYARGTNEPSHYGREKSTANDPYARFDRNATSRARTTTSTRNTEGYQRNEEGSPRNPDTYHPRAVSRPERSYGEARNTSTYHPQTARPERSYGAAANRYRPEPAYRSHAAPNAGRPAERSHPAEHSEAHHSESNHREH